MRKLQISLVIVLTLIAALWLFGRWAQVDVLNVPGHIRVGSGLLAKLACSGHFVSELPQAQAIRDAELICRLLVLLR